MSFSRKLRQALALPPHIIVKKAFEITKRNLKKKLLRKNDYSRCTYSTAYTNNQPLHSYVAPHAKDSLQSYETLLHDLSKKYLNHQIDVLGSGWVSLHYGTVASGVEGSIYTSSIKNVNEVILSEYNINEGARIKNLIGADYQYIDWQKDIKSGYRWSEKTWYKDNRYGMLAGVDVKVPWEISRFHHLVHLAYCHILNNTTGSLAKDSSIYANEFRNQVLDFITFNPPRFGVNWVTSMDVGIRAANILIAYDLFIMTGYTFDKGFNEVFQRSIYEHGKHIINNLEWSADLRGNHYLADCVGLLYCAAYLPSTPEVDAWFAFSIQEISTEILLQFLPDGGNFEASVPYHRLSLEMVLCALAFVHHLPHEKIRGLQKYDHTLIKDKPLLRQSPLPLYNKPAYVRSTLKQTPFSDEVYDRVLRAIEFTYSMVQFADTIPQIGDNDSGRFLKLTPEYEWKENELTEIENKHRHLLGLAASIFSDETLNAFENEFPLENLYENINTDNGKLDFLTDKEVSSFSDFGLYIRKEELYSCAIRAGSIGQRGKGGHAHNDQLSFIFAIDNTIVFTDPGTYLYTPAWKERNLFRGTAMHNTLSVKGLEQNQWVEGPGDVLFWMLGDKAKAKVQRFDSSIFVGEHIGYGDIHQRILKFSENDIIGTDTCNSTGEKQLHFHLSPDVECVRETDNMIVIHCNNRIIHFSSEAKIIINDSDFSDGYGKKQKTKQLIIPMSDNECTWKISIKK